MLTFPGALPALVGGPQLTIAEHDAHGWQGGRSLRHRDAAVVAGIADGDAFVGIVVTVAVTAVGGVGLAALERREFLEVRQVVVLGEAVRIGRQMGAFQHRCAVIGRAQAAVEQLAHDVHAGHGRPVQEVTTEFVGLGAEAVVLVVAVIGGAGRLKAFVGVVVLVAQARVEVAVVFKGVVVGGFGHTVGVDVGEVVIGLEEILMVARHGQHHEWRDLGNGGGRAGSVVGHDGARQLCSAHVQRQYRRQEGQTQ